MMTYLSNIGLWLLGFTKLGGLQYKPGWGPRRFLLPYIVNYGSHVLMGGACGPWSRWFYENRRTNKFARAFNSVLDFFDEDHGLNAGPVLWDTQPVPWQPRLLILAAYAALIYFLVFVRGAT